MNCQFVREVEKPAEEEKEKEIDVANHPELEEEKKTEIKEKKPTPNKAPPTNEDLDTCKICYSEKSNTVFIECGHMVACDVCAKLIMETDERSCPICRKKILKVIRVYK